ncbi:MAG: hypothetical protein ABI635_10090 [Actinomycetota bacterium]
MGPLRADILDAELPPTVAAPSIARGLVRSAGSELSRRSLEDAQLLVSELVSNLLVAAIEPHPLHLRMQTHGSLSLAVEELPLGTDVMNSAVRPGPIARTVTDPPSTFPWGCGLVAALADAWGVSARDGRTSAWAELRLHP